MIRKPFFFYQFLLFFTTSINVKWITADRPEKIVGGTDTEIELYPFLASLRLFDNHNCGGAIISPVHILTAAHCIEDMRNIFTFAPKKVMVKTASKFTRGRDGNLHPIAGIISHPDYKNGTGYRFDIGMVKLANPIRFNDKQQPIDLANEKLPVHVVTEIIGWGLTNWKNRSSPIILQRMQSMTLSQDECNTIGRMTRIIQPAGKETLFCSYQSVGRGICSGDSGGPMTYKNRIVGVVSRGVPCATGVPDMFIDVYKFRDWIFDTMKTM